MVKEPQLNIANRFTREKALLLSIMMKKLLKCKTKNDNRICGNTGTDVEEVEGYKRLY